MRYTLAISAALTLMAGAAAAGPSYTYSTSGTTSATASGTPQYTVWLKANVPVVITTCGTTSDDTYLRLKSGGTEVASNDDSSLCGLGSRITYTPSADGYYVVWAGCYSANSCSATVRVHWPMLLDQPRSGSAGTIVAIHGHGNCSAPNGAGYDSRCGGSPLGYWQNSTSDGGDGHDLLDDASMRVNSDGSQVRWSVVTLRWDGTDQPLWDATNDIGYCLSDLIAGTNYTGCNGGALHATTFKIFGHSEAGAVIDRIWSTGWYAPVTGATQGWPVSISGALAGSRAASALYGVDNASNFCTSLVSWLAGWALKDNGTASLTRGTVIGEARNGKAGKSPTWILKVTTDGGSGSCNNNYWDGVSEDSNDFALGVLSGCVGYSEDDDTDGIVWMYDSDPTSNPGGSNGGKYQADYTGHYWHWVASHANHSHTRNDAYRSKYGQQNTSGCYFVEPGTCLGQYAW